MARKYFTLTCVLLFVSCGLLLAQEPNLCFPSCGPGGISFNSDGTYTAPVGTSLSNIGLTSSGLPDTLGASTGGVAPAADFGPASLLSGDVPLSSFAQQVLGSPVMQNAAGTVDFLGRTTMVGVATIGGGPVGGNAAFEFAFPDAMRWVRNHEPQFGMEQMNVTGGMGHMTTEEMLAAANAISDRKYGWTFQEIGSFMPPDAAQDLLANKFGAQEGYQYYSTVARWDDVLKNYGPVTNATAAIGRERVRDSLFRAEVNLEGWIERMQDLATDPNFPDVPIE